MTQLHATRSTSPLAAQAPLTRHPATSPPGPDLLSLLPDGPTERVASGRTLLARGDTARRMILLVDGQAEVVVGEGSNELVVGELWPGQQAGSLGLLGLLPRRLATVRTRGACLVRTIEPGELAAHARSEPGLLLELERGAISALLVHLDTVSRQLLDLPGIVARPACPARTPPVQAHLPPALASFLQDGDWDSPPEGGLHFRPTGPDGWPQAWMVLQGAVRRVRRRPGGGEVELAPARAGGLGGFEDALGHAHLAETVIAGRGAVIARLPASLCLAALDGHGAQSTTLRWSMARSLAHRVYTARRQLLAAAVSMGLDLDDCSCDQELMLEAGMRELPGAL